MKCTYLVWALVLGFATMPLNSEQSTKQECPIYKAIDLQFINLISEKCHGTVVYVSSETIDIGDAWGIPSDQQRDELERDTERVGPMFAGTSIKAYVEKNRSPTTISCLPDIKQPFEMMSRKEAIRYVHSENWADLRRRYPKV